MNPQWSLWLASLLLTGASTWMVCLILLRLRRDRQARAREADRAALVELLVGMVLAPSPELQKGLARFIGQTRLMAEVILDLQVIVRGDEERRVQCTLRELGLTERFVAEFNRSSYLAPLYAEALAALGGQKATEALNAAAAHRNPEVRLTALRYAVQYGAGVAIRQLLSEAASKRLAASLPFADLIRQVTAASPQDAIDAWQDESQPAMLRAMLIDALGSCGDYCAVETLIQAAAHRDVEIRTAATSALGRFMHPEAEPAIASSLEDAEWLVRAAGAEAAGQARLAAVAPRLMVLLDDDEWWVRLRAGEALTLLGATDIRVLRLMATNGSPAARSTAGALPAGQAAA